MEPTTGPPEPAFSYERDLWGHPFGAFPGTLSPTLLGWPMFGWTRVGERPLLVDEYEQDGALVVEAEAPGIDPEADLEVTAAGGRLHICVRCHEAHDAGRRSYVRHELDHDEQRTRDLPLPEGAESAELRATYKDGILEIRIPLHPDRGAAPMRVPVTKA